MAKRIMRSFKLNEISAVDRPAQKHARMVIMKRDVSDKERERLADEGEAMPDGSYPIASVADLKNAIKAYGRAKNKAAVKAHIIRRAKALDATDALPEGWLPTADDKAEKIAKAVYDAVSSMGAKTFAQTYAEAQRQQVSNELWPLYCALQDSISSIVADTSLDDTARMSAIQRSVDEFLTTVKDKLPDAETELEKLFADSALCGAVVAGRAGDPVSKKETSMPDETKKVADLEKAVVDLTKRAETAEAVAKMSDAEKAHYEKLADADKAAFLAKSADERKAIIAKASEADPVIYKSANGTEYRKSDDPRLVDMAKRTDEAEKIAKAEREARETAEFAKRAETEAAHLPGETSAKAAVLKHMASAPEEVRKAFDAIVKAADKSMAGAFEKRGVSGGNVAGDDPLVKLETLAKAHAEKNNMAFAKAYDAVLQTAEGQQLYSQARQAA